jgi:hypothetical protein
MVGKPVIPAQAGILNVRDLRDLDSGSPLRFARNDGGFGLSQCHSGQTTFFLGNNRFKSEVERMLQRLATPGKPGRPSKKS